MQTQVCQGKARVLFDDFLEDSQTLIYILFAHSEQIVATLQIAFVNLYRDFLIFHQAVGNVEMPQVLTQAVGNQTG